MNGTSRSYNSLIEDFIFKDPLLDILVNGFKAQVVASSIVAAVRYKYELEIAIQNKIEVLKALPDAERDDDKIKQLEFLKVQAIVSSMGNNEPGYISEARREALDTDAKTVLRKILIMKSLSQVSALFAFVTVHA